jgi:PqqD family protein of HPr-rel-A system
MSDVLRWRVAAGVRLHVRSWDGEFVLYNSASGDTHLLDARAAYALKVLERQPLSLAELVEIISALLEVEPNAKLSANLERLLSQFFRLGLLERVQQ